jgi:hypothetical protein
VRTATFTTCDVGTRESPSHSATRDAVRCGAVRCDRCGAVRPVRCGRPSALPANSSCNTKRSAAQRSGSFRGGHSGGCGRPGFCLRMLSLRLFATAFGARRRIHCTAAADGTIIMATAGPAREVLQSPKRRTSTHCVFPTSRTWGRSRVAPGAPSHHGVPFSCQWPSQSPSLPGRLPGTGSASACRSVRVRTSLAGCRPSWCLPVLACRRRGGRRGGRAGV